MWFSRKKSCVVTAWDTEFMEAHEKRDTHRIYKFFVSLVSLYTTNNLFVLESPIVLNMLRYLLALTSFENWC